MQITNLITKLSLTLTLALVAACGGSETPAGTTNNTNNNNQGTTDPTFATVFDQVIAPGCSCHLGATGAGGLAMPDVVTAYSALVDQPATAGGPCEGGTRVQTGQPTSSVLYRKVAGVDLCGAPMPMGGAALSQDQLDLIRDWIAGGAVER